MVAGGWGTVAIPLWWSPDGEWLLYRGGSRGHDVRWVRVADRREVVLKFPEEVGDVGLGISSDGKNLQLYRNSHNFREALKIAPIRGGGFAEVKLSRLPDYISEPVYAPNRQRVAFAGMDKGGNPTLYVAPAAGGDPVPVRLDAAFDKGIY